MSNQSQKYIKNAIAASNKMSTVLKNTPKQYADRKTQYMADRVRKFDSNRAYLASDYFNAEVQGLSVDDFYKWINTNIRLSDLSSNDSKSFTGSKTDDFKLVLFPEKHIDYFPIGAKIKTAGSVWLSINPSNVSSVKPTAVVARCNSSYNSFDYYGNVVTEPIVVERYAMMNNSNETPNNLVLPDGYFNVTCQLNDNTKQIKQNYRLILGSQSFYVTGVTDFIQEFSGDRDSCHLLNFTIRKEENINEYDDLEKTFIANGKNSIYSATLDGADKIKVGQIAQLTAHFSLNDVEILPTEDKPLTWIYSSSDNGVVSVNANGEITANKNGNAIITATLAENTAITATLEVAVAGDVNEPYVAFLGVLPTEITQYDEAVVKARYYEEGAKTNKPLSWSFGGAKDNCYVATIAPKQMSAQIQCLKASVEPLVVTVSYGEYSATTEIALNGY